MLSGTLNPTIPYCSINSVYCKCSACLFRWHWRRRRWRHTWSDLSYFILGRSYRWVRTICAYTEDDKDLKAESGVTLEETGGKWLCEFELNSAGDASAITAAFPTFISPAVDCIPRSAWRFQLQTKLSQFHWQQVVELRDVMSIIVLMYII